MAKRVVKEIQPSATFSGDSSLNTPAFPCYMAKMITIHGTTVTDPAVFGTTTTGSIATRPQFSHNGINFFEIPTELTQQGGIVGVSMHQGGRTLVISPVAPMQYIPWRFGRMVLATNGGSGLTLVRVVATSFWDDDMDEFAESVGPAGIDVQAICTFGSISLTITGMTAADQDILRSIPLQATVTGPLITAGARVQTNTGNGSLGITAVTTGAATAPIGSVVRFTA